MVFRQFKKKLRSICLGWWAFVSGSTPGWAKNRLDICLRCKSNRFWVCTECGCMIGAKARAEDEECPLKKWKARPIKVTHKNW